MPIFWWTRRPSALELAAALAAARKDECPLPPTLAANLFACPPGFKRLHVTQRVSSDDPAEALRRVRELLLHFRQYPDWTRVFDAGEAASAGKSYVVLISHMGFASLNAFRVVAIDDTEQRFALTLATLRAHAEEGEETFAVALTDQALELSITSYSRGRHWLARLGAPLLRWYQRRFLQQALSSLSEAAS